MIKSKFFSIFTLLILLTFLMVGCSTGKDTAGGGSGKSGDEAIESTESKDSSKSGDVKAQDSVAANPNSDGKTPVVKTYDQLQQENNPPELREQMDKLAGTWESATPIENGNASVVRVKMDNSRGFTITTGTQGPDGKGNFYSRVGSYEIENGTITFSATTGGESNDGTSYNLRQDLGVFQYTYSLNPENTQLTLTPSNDKAKLLTGEGAVVLSKT